MAVQGNYNTWALIAAEDLNNLNAGTGHLFKAINAQTRKLATGGLAACGILQEGGATNEHITIGINGVQKFVAGGAVSSADTFLTVTTSGYFTAAGSGDYVVGKSLFTVASGAVGTGLFNFANPWYKSE